jgi:hypothetical protein
VELGLWVCLHVGGSERTVRYLWQAPVPVYEAPLCAVIQDKGRSIWLLVSGHHCPRLPVGGVCWLRAAMLARACVLRLRACDCLRRNNI